MEKSAGPFNLLYQDDDLVAIDKPSGYLVHPPENPMFKVPASRIVLSQLRRQLQKFVYPIHRLDVATSGILLFGLSKESASELNRSFRDQTVQKVYQAIVRGYAAESFTVDRDLESEHGGRIVTARTDFQLRAKVELPYAVGKKYSTSRYSWVEARPLTGRYHQIRRHLNRVAHPIIGDHDHGDSHHNRFFRDTLQISGLCLRASELEIAHPRTGLRIKIQAPADTKWSGLEKMFSHSWNRSISE